MLKPEDVFTPGKLPINPTNVYAQRGSSQKRYESTIQIKNIPLVYGEYGVGKTSMARYIALEDEKSGKLLYIESAHSKEFKDVIGRCLEKIDHLLLSKASSSSSAAQANTEGGEATMSAGFASAKVKSQKSTSSQETKTYEYVPVVTTPTDSKFIEICEKVGAILIIDELHRADIKFKEHLAGFIKAYSNSNCSNFRIALLGTSRDAHDLVSLDNGIDRIIHEIKLPQLSQKESTYIVERGMEDLNIQINRDQIEKIVSTAVGSPNILQYICLRVAMFSFERKPKREVQTTDILEAIDDYISSKENRLLDKYTRAIETTGPKKYRKLILRSMCEFDGDFATMDDIRSGVSKYVGEDVPPSSLSGPLRDLKNDAYGKILKDVSRDSDEKRLYNTTCFTDPAMKSFIRMCISIEKIKEEAREEPS